MEGAKTGVIDMHCVYHRDCDKLNTSYLKIQHCVFLLLQSQRKVVIKFGGCSAGGLPDSFEILFKRVLQLKNSAKDT